MTIAARHLDFDLARNVLILAFLLVKQSDNLVAKISLIEVNPNGGNRHMGDVSLLPTASVQLNPDHFMISVFRHPTQNENRPTTTSTTGSESDRFVAVQNAAQNHRQ